MTRCVPLLFLLTLVGGCKALVRDAEAIAYQPGATPGTTVTKCDATYELDAKNPHTGTKYGWDTFDVPKGATVGFRREPDGSLVAVAGQRVETIPDERAVWRYTPKPATSLDRFAVRARDKCEDVALAIVLAPLLMGIVFSGGEVPY